MDAAKWIDEVCWRSYYTLKLPWSLGADFYLRHLLDGDPAVNTLSWRWVAGLHTQGNAYLATAAVACGGPGLNRRWQFT